MDELVVVEVVGTEPEAELLCLRLRSAGIERPYLIALYSFLSREPSRIDMRRAFERRREACIPSSGSSGGVPRAA
jgi:hypothetical protein